MTTATTSNQDLVSELQAEILALKAVIQKLGQENHDLLQYIEHLRRGRFGRSSEKLDPNQLDLFSEDDNAVVDTTTKEEPVKEEPAKPTKSKQNNGHGRKPFPAHLPRQIVEHDVPESERTCDHCQDKLVFFGEDTCERGHIVPATFVINRHVTKKYGCPNGHMVKCGAGAPVGVITKAKYETSVYAHVAVAKYGDHLPLYRQENIFKRMGIDLAKSTMVDMIQLIYAHAAAAIVEEMHRQILAERVIQADETPITVLMENDNKPSTGFVWVYHARGKFVFVFRPSRENTGSISFLGSWKGIIQTDGYSGYDEPVRRNQLTRAGCWAHVRRKWKDAFDAGSVDAAMMLALIQRLYRIERAIKRRVSHRKMCESESAALRHSVRQRRSRVIVERIAQLVEKIGRKSTTTPKSLLGKAVTYTTIEWQTLLVFMDEESVDVDNNAVERAIRPIAVGRRNWLFAGSPRGAEAAATLYSLINACKALGINPEAYLADVLELASPNADFSRLTPWAWAEARGINSQN